MIETKLYICEYCGTQYKEKAKAEKCEATHLKKPKVKDMRNHAMNDVPDKIEIVFENGKSIWYKR